MTKSTNITKSGVMDHIKLIGTAVEGQYKGAGAAFLVIANGEPTKLIYENPECPPVRKELSEDDIFQLFEDNGVCFHELEKAKGQILMGDCSCYDFCFPEILIDTCDKD
ncbi:hypothetical protein [Sporosarcina sp. A2]|uniref:hypothetical protein n=1 Tax=Sporosarcina sp. A2 TaxID=3393449 RepID=UPI003D7AA420